MCPCTLQVLALLNYSDFLSVTLPTILDNTVNEYRHSEDTADLEIHYFGVMWMYLCHSQPSFPSWYRNGSQDFWYHNRRRKGQRSYRLRINLVASDNESMEIVVKI